MPTLNRRADHGDTLHPKQTEFYVNAKPPEAGNITYQVDRRAVDFLTEVRGYADGDDLPWSLVHVLRQIRDLFTLHEGRPRETEAEGHANEAVTVPTFDDGEASDLVDYLRDHPDVSGDVGAFETRLEERDDSYIDAIRRTSYTPSSTPGFDGTGNEPLDRIAQQYFDDGTADFIEWNGDRVYDYVVVSDRDGNSHQFPRIESRLPEGERLRLSRDIFERWGSEIGDSEVVSRRYEPSEEEFSNRWIGQCEGSPEPTLERASSPRAFFYRTLAGRSNYAPGTEADEAFEEACDYSLDVYRANFPTAVDPRDLRTEYVTIEEATEPWQDFQVPPRWAERYDATGGVPPLKRDSPIPDHFDERVRTAIERHAPGGDGPIWFDSLEVAVDHFDTALYRDVLLVADQIEYPVEEFGRGKTGQLGFELEFHSRETTLHVSMGEGSIEIASITGGTHRIQFDSPHLTSWAVPETERDQAAHRVLEEQAAWFDEVADLIARFGDAVDSWPSSSACPRVVSETRSTAEPSSVTED